MADPITSGTTGETTESAPEATQDTGTVATGTTGAETAQAKPEAESFIDPSQLPEELKPHWKRMHGAYTKKMQDFAEHKKKADLVDRFGTDPAFALQTIQQAAQQLGYQLTPAQAAAMVGTSPQRSDVPPQLVEAVKARLSPELQWMADSLATAQWEANKMILAPIQQGRQQEIASQREQEYESLSGELTQTAPGWEQHEDDMEALLNFLASDRMRDPRFGSKLTLLYHMVTQGSHARADAADRMAQAGRNRTVVGSPGRQTAPNIEQRIRAAKTDQEKLSIAADAAIQELKEQGIEVAR